MLAKGLSIFYISVYTDAQQCPLLLLAAPQEQADMLAVYKGTGGNILEIFY